MQQTNQKEIKMEEELKKQLKELTEKYNWTYNNLQNAYKKIDDLTKRMNQAKGFLNVI